MDAGRRASAAPPNAINVRTSRPQSLPMLMSCCPASINIADQRPMRTDLDCVIAPRLTG